MAKPKRKPTLPPVWIYWHGDTPIVVDETCPQARLYLPRKHAEINKGSSPTVVSTPPVFLDFVRVLLGGEIFWDLAAVEANAVGKLKGHYFGPDAEREHARDSLKLDWVEEFFDIGTDPDLFLWLNPPYDKITPWVEKCALTIAQGYQGRIAVLVPSSVGSKWYEQHVFDKCDEYQVGRIPFVGYGNGAMKDHMLLIYRQKPAEGYTRGLFREWKAVGEAAALERVPK